MSPALVEAFIPVMGMLVVFGMPVAILFVLKWFKLKEREMALEGEARQWAEKKQAALEERVKRLEDVLISLDQDVRARLGLGQEGAPPHAQRELMEGPATPAHETGRAADPSRVKAR